MTTPNRALAPRLLHLAITDAIPDADLLARFVRARDESAFAQLVERHGPMVLGVCRRVIGKVHEAEDAFQAAFLALARNAGRIRSGDSLTAWLYGVAVRVSLKARGVAARDRRANGRPPVRTAPDPLAEITGRELVAAIDEELARLPKQFRLAVVLCCLEGLSQDEAARRLGWSAGSVKGRLERGRVRLKERLARRGLALSAALAGVALGDARAVVPPHVFARTVGLAASHGTPPAVAQLAAVAVASGTVWKLAAVAVLILAVGGGATIGRRHAPAQAPAPKQAGHAAAGRADRFGDPLPDGAVVRLGTNRLRHAALFSLAFAHDGALVSFGRDYVVKAWDPASGRLLREREFEKEKIHRFWGGRLSPDGQRLAVQLNNRMKVFDVVSGKELASVKLGGAWEARAGFSPDGKHLAVVDSDNSNRPNAIQLCDLATGACREISKVRGYFSEPVFSHDGARLALPEGSEDGIVVWETATGKELLRFKPPGLRGGTVDFDPTGDVLAVLGAINPPQAFHYVQISTGKPPEGWVAPKVADFEWVRFSPDGQSMLLGGRKSLQWCDPKTGKVIHSVDDWAATPPAFSPDGKLAASGRQNAIRLWDAATGRPADPENLDQAPEEEVHGVAISPDGRWLVTKGDGSGTIWLWDSNGKPKGSIKSNRAGGRYPIFSADGRHLFGMAPDAIALVRWDFPGGKEVTRYTFAEPIQDQVYVYHFGLSADGKRLASVTQTVNRPGRQVVGGGGPGAVGETATFTVWDVATARRLESREVDTPGLMGYGAFAPDLRWYAHADRAYALAGGSDLRLEWPKEWSAWQGAASPDGRLVAQLALEYANDGTGTQLVYRVVVHEMATGKQVLTLPTGYAGPIAFTADSRGLIVTDTGAITLWNLAAKKPVARHKSPGRFVGSYGGSFASSLAVKPDGTVMTGHSDTTALVWRLAAPVRQPRDLGEQDLLAAWNALAGAEAGKAFAAAAALADSGNGAVKFLCTRLKPVAAPADEQMRKLIAQLGAEEFADREAAERELRALGDAAAPALHAALKAGLSDEQTRRIGPIVRTAEASTIAPGQRLQTVRAVAVLEWIGTKEARDQLKRLAEGVNGARLTREARSAAGRLERNQPR
jgi:RNA polymerase sigma factor (sigma-70 family)